MSTAALPLAVPRAPTNKWLVTLSVTFGTLMGAIDASIVNVALTQIRASVGATQQEITWISTGFVIATVMVMPLTAFLGRLFGQKRVYLTCLALFVVGSFLCGFAWNLWSLVAFRAIQGFGAGALQPTEQAILRQTFPPKEQGTAMALFSMAVMIGPAIGPTLGGYIVDNFHWSWIFFINVPVGVVGFFMVARFVQDDAEIREAGRAEAERQRKNMDWLGIALMFVGLAALQFFLEEGQSKDWFESVEIQLSGAVALFALVGFVWRELTAPAPVVNLRLFKDRTFASGSVINAVMFSILIGSMLLLPMFMQELLGFTATQSGLALMPRTLVMMVCMPIMGKLYSKVPARAMIAVGIVLTGLGVLQLSHLSMATGSGQIMGAIALQGVGFSMMLVPLTTVALSSIPRHKMADATGLNSLLRQIGGSIGIASFVTLLLRNAAQAFGSMISHFNPERPEVMERLAQYKGALMARGLDAASASEGALKMLSGIVHREAMVIAFDKLFFLCSLLFLVALPLLWFLKQPKDDGPKEAAHVEMEI